MALTGQCCGRCLLERQRMELTRIEFQQFALHVLFTLILTTYYAAITIKPFSKWGSGVSKKPIDFVKGRKILTLVWGEALLMMFLLFHYDIFIQKRKSTLMDCPVRWILINELLILAVMRFTTWISKILHIQGKRDRDGEDDRLAPGLLRCLHFLNESLPYWQK